MIKILFQYLFFGFLKTIFKVTLIVYCFGIILNLFEEIEFFKNLDVSVLMPITLTALYIPSMIIKLLPFIIFVSSMWFLLYLRNSSDLLTLKVFGYSNFRIFFILASISFIFGWFVLLALNPITSQMVRYYEQTKSEFSRDIDHLVSINKNGLWIKENVSEGYRIISADESRDYILNNLRIFNLDENFKLLEKINAKTADITTNSWVLNEVIINKFTDNMPEKKIVDEYYLKSTYDHKKIMSLFSNFDTMSFIDLLLNYKNLQRQGYNKNYLDQNLNNLMSLPFFLFIMTALAAILTMNTLKKSNNFKFIITGMIACVLIFYFKDLSLALGQTDRIPLSLAAWVPVVLTGLLAAIGILQINEK